MAQLWYMCQKWKHLSHQRIIDFKGFPTPFSYCTFFSDDVEQVWPVCAARMDTCWITEMWNWFHWCIVSTITSLIWEGITFIFIQFGLLLCFIPHLSCGQIITILNYFLKEYYCFAVSMIPFVFVFCVVLA